MAFDSVDSVLNHHSEQTKSAAAAFKRDLQKVRTGRASSGLVESIMVDYYGSKTQLGHLGQISTPEARLIVIQVYDAGAIPAIEKALKSGELGLNPQREGSVLRISIPALTEEVRKDIVRLVHKMAEEIRVSIRAHRRDANEELKRLEKDGKLTKDESKKALDKIQKQTDLGIAEVDKLLAAKEAEVIEV